MVVPTWGLWSFSVMPFGLTGAPSTFQALMDKILPAGKEGPRGRERFCWAYLDDVIITSKGFNSALSNLAEVFEALIKHKLKLHPLKCCFFRKELLYLGQWLTPTGITTNKAKCQAVLDWRTPRTPAEVRSFLGLTNYLSSYIAGYAEKAACLYRLTEKNKSFVWTQEAEETFQALKKAVTSPPVLAYPRRCERNYEEPDKVLTNNEGIYIVDTDASLTAAGGMLSQVQDGVERVIAYHSHAFTRTERNWCATRRELIAVLIIVKVWQPYLLHRKFIIRTDNNAVTRLRRLKSPEQQLFRWLAFLEGFDCEIVHRKGTLHTAPDALSRRPCPEDCRHCQKKEEKDPFIEDIDM